MLARRKGVHWVCHQYQGKEVCVLLQAKWTLVKKPVWVNKKTCVEWTRGGRIGEEGLSGQVQDKHHLPLELQL